MKGKFVSSDTRLKISKSLMGKKHSEETRKKMSESHKGISTWNKGLKGYHASIKTQFKIGQLIGEKSYTWKGGIAKVNNKIRGSVEYRLWRKSVYERDEYTCIWCGDKNKKLHADHIKPFAFFPELRFAIDNGRTLCTDCHKKTGTWGKH